ncbi:secreted RxLR effector protein 161-like [Xenia sp. Carnegie-2017]|uniref:secreted RxLR effector protein 161-like n=1 Tax=Xenia sp. Carnegie-2017 TaxID=2897299 RepID=UPI001F03B951|nr:secreted RxLR effector protein 161-like [Xenia sp. Carnegie-2017]
MGQTTYTKTILNKFGMKNFKQVGTPVESCSKHMKCTEDSEMFDIHNYQSTFGSLLYVVYTWTAVKRIFRYLKGTFDYGLHYTPETSLDCVRFSDADWGGDINDRKSTSGYIFIMNGAAVSWKSKKQSCVALSTAEAEYIALRSAVQEAI